MIVLNPPKAAMAKNLTLPFGGSGGVAPYSYSVLAGGVGGTINPVTGVYTSPDAYGSDTIQVVDQALSTATSSVIVGSPLDLFCDVLATELQLDPSRIWIWDQKISEPKDQGLYIPVQVLSSKPFSNSREYLNGVEILSTNVQTILSIDLKSRNMDAFNRKEEVILAIHSTYSEQQQELNSFRIFPIPHGVVNLSQQDGAAIPYRFNITVAIQYFVVKSKLVPYYDKFQETSVTVEQ